MSDKTVTTPQPKSYIDSSLAPNGDRVFTIRLLAADIMTGKLKKELELITRLIKALR